MNPRIAWIAAAALACALLAGGCSSAPGTAASRHDAGVHLSPDPAFSSSNLTVTLEDPRLDPRACTYVWKRNGEPIPGATAGTLPPASFGRGDRIAVVVTVRDAGSGQSRSLGAELQIANSPPVIDHATLALTTASGKAEVQTTVSSTDPDGDRVTYEYRWFKNGTLIAGAAGPSLPASDFARGDKVSAEVVASDGQGKSAPVRADPVGLENHPPQFTSQPYAPGAKDDAFHYRAIATDADGDSLRYELVQGPSGMTVDPNGNVSWTLPPRESRRGDQPVVIRASDPAGGQATQEFTIHLDAPPASH